MNKVYLTIAESSNKEAGYYILSASDSFDMAWVKAEAYRELLKRVDSKIERGLQYSENEIVKEFKTDIIALKLKMTDDLSNLLYDNINCNIDWVFKVQCII